MYENRNGKRKFGTIEELIRKCSVGGCLCAYLNVRVYVYTCTSVCVCVCVYVCV